MALDILEHVQSSTDGVLYTFDTPIEDAEDFDVEKLCASSVASRLAESNKRKIHADFEKLLSNDRESELTAFKTNTIASGRTLDLADKH